MHSEKSTACNSKVVLPPKYMMSGALGSATMFAMTYATALFTK